LQVKENIKAQEENELYTKTEQVGDDDRNGGHKARKVDLAKDASIADEGIGGSVQAGGEVTPHDIAGEVKQVLRQPVCGQTGNVAEDDGEDEGGDQRLNDEPQGA